LKASEENPEGQKGTPLVAVGNGGAKSEANYGISSRPIRQITPSRRKGQLSEQLKQNASALKVWAAFSNRHLS
jgi:hypothetical protein